MHRLSEHKRLSLARLSAYIEQLGALMAKPSVRQHLAAIRQLFD